MRESEFQTKVIRYLRSLGAYVLNVPGGSQIPKGTPDLLVCYKGRFIALELKTDTGTVMPLQEDTLETIRRADGYTRVLRPKDWEHFVEDFKDFDIV